MKMPQSYNIWQPDFFTFWGAIAALIASSNTPFNPSCVNAEHSTYPFDPNSFAKFSPSCCVNGDPILLSTSWSLHTN